MRVIVISENDFKLNYLSRIITERIGNCEINKFTDSMLAIKYLINNDVNSIYVETRIKHMSAYRFIGLARKLRPDVNISVVSDDEQLQTAAIEAGADEYIIEDISIEYKK